TVCHSAHCPNISECWGRGTATFMIMGDRCTRNCRFCAIDHGIPDPPDPEEPRHLAEAAEEMGLQWIVVTSVTRDDLPDGGSGHFARVISEVRRTLPDAGIETLVPDFKRCQDDAVDTLSTTFPDVLNHNMETVSRLYRRFRPGADYDGSLKLLKMFGKRGLITKSGIFVGVGETTQEILDLLQDIRSVGVRILTIGQYLQPSKDQLPVERYVHPDEFKDFADFAYSIGFDHVASGPLVRSSYRAEEAAKLLK
ncbi:MAG: lipoyl synthase, partial [Candidatus Electryoneaceae bacterium]|nr:lipoyl synthase [Candidatus Electryoneaceae bacterium]